MYRHALNCLLSLLAVVCVGSLRSVHAGLHDNNLIEFSFGSYGNMSRRAWLWPPFVKIYQDGTIIHYERENDGRFFVSHLTEEQLVSLKKRLAGEKYLWKSRFIEMAGEELNVHGGVSYIRYLNGDNEILLATEVKPRGGPWVQLTEAIWTYVPNDSREPYYPARIGVHAGEDNSDYTDRNPPAWPFDKRIKLSSKLKMISDPEVIHYLFDRLERSFSFYVWNFKQDDKQYSIFLHNSPGWFEQDYLNKVITKLRKSGYRVQERQ